VIVKYILDKEFLEINCYKENEKDQVYYFQVFIDSTNDDDQYQSYV